MVRIGTLVKCSWADEKPTLFGVLIGMTGKINGGTGDSWAEIYWTDGHTTWEEWDASINQCFEVIA
jgi:hypothetical protein